MAWLAVQLMVHFCNLSCTTGECCKCLHNKPHTAWQRHEISWKRPLSSHVNGMLLTSLLTCSCVLHLFCVSGYCDLCAAGEEGLS